MHDVTVAGEVTESQFAAMVDALAAAHDRPELIALLREDLPVYDQRGGSAVVRMRGWVLLALAKTGVTDTELLFVLEELDTGVDAYLVAAAARALRSYAQPNASLARYVMGALDNIRYHDEPVEFEGYGEYAVGTSGTSPVRELLLTLAWLGPHARGVLTDLETMRAERAGLSSKLRVELDRAIESIGCTEGAGEANDACCSVPVGLGNALSWAFGARAKAESVRDVVFQDHDGATLPFPEFFHGQPSIVVFFYTRCDNPLKCSLTVTKLARVQKLLEKRGVADRIRTAAITYDPEYDLPERIHGYGQNRGVRLDPGHRMLRVTEGFDALRSHFKLGVNFIESLVNRHRLEVFVLNADGRIAASFERVHWDEQLVVDQAIKVLEEGVRNNEPDVLSTAFRRPDRALNAPLDNSGPNALSSAFTRLGRGSETFGRLKAVLGTRSLANSNESGRERKSRLKAELRTSALGTIASFALAIFPKCPICWAAYMSMFGIAGFDRIPYSPWLKPVFLLLVLVNLASVWLRGRATGRMIGFYLAAAGAAAIIAARTGVVPENFAYIGVGLTMAGSLLSALQTKRRDSLRNDCAAKETGPSNPFGSPESLGSES
jgi:protein SCO1/2